MLSLEKKLLIAAPSIEEETLFHRSLVYIDRHSNDSTIGFIVNKPSDVKVGELLSTTGISKDSISQSVASQPVYIGGPVNTSKMFILHMNDDLDEEKSNKLLGAAKFPTVSTSDDTLREIGVGEGPKRHLIMLGCSSWESGQLSKEYCEDSWISLECLPDIIFDAKADERIMLAASHVGFDINMMVAKHSLRPMTVEGVILAIDPGRKKTGVALGNTLTGDAKPLRTVNGGFDLQINEVMADCERWKPVAVIVALPDPEIAAKSNRYCRRFAETLTGKTGIKTTFFDEAYTTQAARLMEDKSAGIDANAACVLAQDWLSQRKVGATN